MRLYYVDYVNHMLKNYVGHAIENLQNETERTNWYACDRAMQTLDEPDRKMIWEIYGRVTYKDPKPLPAVVNEYCVDTNQDFGIVMNLVRRITKMVKKERGL